ncbi:AzlD domain-containing protein [uncultured Endozoicomonas sp.]|uniref:AzlD domain-containing protein n=1 Tax=uncultured Endozoicomonas sp. TaxID=432652 RepID=UPI0026348603|nr:AzlD domain-containing protein [uncultured Endozoicomonas sp.]
MNTWSILLCVAVLVYGSRFLLMEPWLPLRLSQNVQQLLTYSAPAVLTAIATPIVFFPEKQLSISIDNHYLVASIIVVLLAKLTKNTLITVVLGMLCFALLHR